MALRIPSPRTSNNPLFVTPLPSAIPPIAMNTTVHRNCSKSSCEPIQLHSSQLTSLKSDIPS